MHLPKSCSFYYNYPYIPAARSNCHDEEGEGACEECMPGYLLQEDGTCDGQYANSVPITCV